MTVELDESDVEQFYADAMIPDQRVDEILALGKVTADALRWKRIATALGIVAFGLTIACAVLLVRSRRTTDEGQLASAAKTTLIDPIEKIRPNQTAPEQEVLESAAGSLPKEDGFHLIAIRNHGDECPGCRNVGELFARLQNQLDDGGIDFTLIDLQSSMLSEHAKNEIERPEIRGLIETRRHKALIALQVPGGEIHELDGNAPPLELIRNIRGYVQH